MWYPPKVCSSDTVGFAGHCIEHFYGLAYQFKVSLQACYSYMEDVLLNCLTIDSTFSARGGWGHLVSKDNDGYKLVAPLVPLSTLKRPCSTPSRCSIPHLPVDSVPSTGTSSKTPDNCSLSSGSNCCPSE
ncbi:hypothetical protein DSO57_1005491 [Entomophthora muscae]|uniref:Uncharacterized protein n=1 Tax=Entomophthora muscae TaxID=34485 RepID=A0ACC2U6C3_9FUNG|nr:hypothetical protein DSO57_1005491 [Entomophthora muscae]